MSASVLQYKVYQNTSDDGSIDITFDSAVTGGSTIVVTGGGVNNNYDGPTPEITGISDTQSNTYGTPVNVRVNDWAPSTNMVSAANVAAGSTTITVTLDSTSANIIGFVAFELGGTATASQETIVSGSTAASGTSVSTSSTGTLSQSDCIAVICGQGWLGNPSGATGYTAVLDQSNGVGGNIGTWIGYKSLSSTSSISGTVNHESVASARNAILGIFKSSLSSTYNESASDSGAATETAVAALVATNAASDSASATDTAAGSLTVALAVADSGAATDAATAALMLAEAVSDPVAATDAATVGLVVAEVLSDSVEATDSAAGQAIYAEAVSDSADLSDTTTGDSELDASVADSAEASESISTSLIASDALADAAESSDGVVVTAVYQEVVSDSLSTTESVVGSVGGHSYFESVEDVLEVSDLTLATLLSFGASVRSQGGGSGGGRLWTRDLDEEIEAEMGAILKGPPLTPEVIEEITARLDSPPQTRIMEHRRPAKATYSSPVLDFQAVQAKKRRNRQRLLLLL